MEAFIMLFEDPSAVIIHIAAILVAFCTGLIIGLRSSGKRVFGLRAASSDEAARLREANARAARQLQQLLKDCQSDLTDSGSGAAARLKAALASLDEKDRAPSRSRSKTAANKQHASGAQGGDGAAAPAVSQARRLSPTSSSYVARQVPPLPRWAARDLEDRSPTPLPAVLEPAAPDRSAGARPDAAASRRGPYRLIRGCKPGPLRGLRVLLVDDDPTNLLVLEEMLVELGLEAVCSASCGTKAVELATSLRFDIIFMDIQMPDINGFEATERIKRVNAHNADIPIVPVTAFSRVVTPQLCREAKMTGFLAKPIDFEKLRACVTKALKADREMRDAPAAPAGG